MIENYKLDNGINVVMEKMEYVKSVAFGIFVKNGSRNENEENNGISHFIEHMLFKGTDKRSFKEIAEEMDSIGGQLNAYTTKEYTCYYARTLDTHLDIAFDILSDMFFNSSFEDSAIEKEAKVIAEEISMYNDSPDDVLFDKLQYNIWKGNSLSYPILGTEKTISGFNHNTLKSYFMDNYCGENTVIAIAGSFDKERVKEKINLLFGKLKAKTNREEIKKPIYQKSTVKIEKDIEQLHFALSYDGIKLNDSLSYAMAVLNTLLGGGMSSRLFQKIREDNGLCYTVYSFNSAYTDTGLFSVYAGMNPEQLSRVYELIKEEITALKRDKISAELINKTKEQIKSNYMMSLESTLNRMSAIGRSMVLLNKASTPEELLEKVDNVNDEMIAQVIESVFENKEPSICIVGKNVDNMEI